MSNTVYHLLSALKVRYPIYLVSLSMLHSMIDNGTILTKYNSNHKVPLFHNYKVSEEGETMVMQQQYDDDHMSHSKKRLRLIIDTVPELRRRIKVAAAQNDLSIQEYVGRILDQVVPPEVSPMQRKYKPLNRAAVDELLRFREEIMRAHPGQVFEDSVETLRQLREERTRELEQR